MAKNPESPNQYLEHRDALYKVYFAGLSSGAPFHSLCVMNNVGHHQIYLEVPEKRKLKKGKLRLFIRKADYVEYARAIVGTEAIDGMMTKRLDMTPTEAADLAIRLNSDCLARGDAGVNAVSCIVIDGKMIELDIFWSKVDQTMIL